MCVGGRGGAPLLRPFVPNSFTQRHGCWLPHVRGASPEHPAEVAAPPSACPGGGGGAGCPSMFPPAGVPPRGCWPELSHLSSRGSGQSCFLVRGPTCRAPSPGPELGVRRAGIEARGPERRASGGRGWSRGDGHRGAEDEAWAPAWPPGSAGRRPLTVHGQAGSGALAEAQRRNLQGASNGGGWELPGCSSLPAAGSSRERTEARPARGGVAVATAPPRLAAAFVSHRRGAPAEEQVPAGLGRGAAGSPMRLCRANTPGKVKAAGPRLRELGVLGAPLLRPGPGDRAPGTLSAVEIAGLGKWSHPGLSSCLSHSEPKKAAEEERIAREAVSRVQ